MSKITDKLSRELYYKLPIYVNIPFTGGMKLAIWNCATRGPKGNKLTLRYNLEEIRITVRDRSGGCYFTIKKGHI